MTVKGQWTSSHQMTANGKRDNFTLDDIKACAKCASMKRGHAERIVEEVSNVVRRWSDYAEDAGVLPEHQDRIQTTLRLNL